MKIFQCAKCKTVVDLVHKGGCTPSCCGDPMVELSANTTDAAQEKHVPAVTVSGSTVTVQVGSTLHPMMAEHYIQFIGLKAGEFVLRKDLTPEDEPKAVFELGGYHGKVEVYELCNLHGLWKAEAEV